MSQDLCRWVLQPVQCYKSTYTQPYFHTLESAGREAGEGGKKEWRERFQKLENKVLVLLGFRVLLKGAYGEQIGTCRKTGEQLKITAIV